MLRGGVGGGGGWGGPFSGISAFEFLEGTSGRDANHGFYPNKETLEEIHKGHVQAFPVRLPASG